MNKKKIVVLGATGVVGQHMMTNVPLDVEPVFVSRSGGPGIQAFDINPESFADLFRWLKDEQPQAIVNLAGENRPDVVEPEPGKYKFINEDFPYFLSCWCENRNIHYVHVSSQAVYGGVASSESIISVTGANCYGSQKVRTDSKLLIFGKSYTIVRPTFILGIRPFSGVGRENPAESMLSGLQLVQVNDRFFSVSFASEVAELLWETARGNPQNKVVLIGSGNFSRTTLYKALTGNTPREVSHSDFPGLAPRPLDTTFPATEEEISWIPAKLALLVSEFKARQEDSLNHRSLELAAFLQIPEDHAFVRLLKPFSHHHEEVTRDFNRANPQSPLDLLNWYRSTEAYLWELTSYHCDPGFNYRGMCRGIAERLKSEDRRRVLVLGDGIGDMSLELLVAGLSPSYHDLADSRTVQFARFRFWARGTGGQIEMRLTEDFEPVLLRFSDSGSYDAVVSADFLEHIPDVEPWVRAIRLALKPGGLFFAQNAFHIGSGPSGSMPMHLECNDHWEFDWDPLLARLGFTQLSSNWYRKDN